jgi:hypothetical protein
MATSEAEIRRQDTSEHITVKRPWFKNDARAGLAVHYGHAARRKLGKARKPFAGIRSLRSSQSNDGTGKRVRTILMLIPPCEVGREGGW